MEGAWSGLRNLLFGQWLAVLTTGSDPEASKDTQVYLAIATALRIASYSFKPHTPSFIQTHRMGGRRILLALAAIPAVAGM